MSTWADLQSLRDAGHRPSGAVWVLSGKDWQLRQNLTDIGSMVIDHDVSEPFPVDLVAGLDVLLMFERCGDAQAAAIAIRDCAQPPKSCRVWCECGKSLSIVPDRCRT